MIMDMEEGADGEKAKQYWDMYRKLGIEPSTQVYNGYAIRPYKGLDGLSVEEAAWREFRESWVCPHCSRKPSEDSTSPFHFDVRFLGEEGYGKLRAHVAIWHFEQCKPPVDRTSKEFWNDVRTLLREGEISHETWTREFMNLWRLVSEVSNRLERKESNLAPANSPLIESAEKRPQGRRGQSQSTS